MTSIEGGYISADGHFVEPADLWVERMDKRFRDRAPRVETRADADWYFIDGVTPFPVGLEGASMEDKIAGEIKMMGGRRHATTRPGAWDPQARLVDLTLDHIKAEVMYPGALGLQFWAAQAEVATATAEFHQAELDFYRAKQLFEEQVLSAQRFDQAKTQYDAAQSRLHAKQQQLEEAKKNEVTREREADHARAALGNASASERSEHSLVKQAEAAVREAELNLSYCTMVAPMEGMVSRKAIEVGQRVQPGQALMALLPLHKVYIEANYKETQLTHVRVGQLVEIRADIYTDYIYHGKVDSLSGGTGAAFSLLPPENATGNWVKVVQRLPVKITLTEPPPPDLPLRVGLSVEASIDISNRDGPRLSSLLQEQGQKERELGNVRARELTDPTLAPTKIPQVRQ